MKNIFIIFLMLISTWTIAKQTEIEIKYLDNGQVVQVTTIIEQTVIDSFPPALTQEQERVNYFVGRAVTVVDTNTIGFSKFPLILNFEKVNTVYERDKEPKTNVVPKTKKVFGYLLFILIFASFKLVEGINFRKGKVSKNKINFILSLVFSGILMAIPLWLYLFIPMVRTNWILVTLYILLSMFLFGISAKNTVLHYLEKEVGIVPSYLISILIGTLLCFCFFTHMSVLSIENGIYLTVAILVSTLIPTLVVVLFPKHK